MQVRLKDLVDYVGEVLGHSVTAAGLEPACAAAAQQASAQLHAQAQALAAGAANAPALHALLRPQLAQLCSAATSAVCKLPEHSRSCARFMHTVPGQEKLHRWATWELAE